MTFKWFCCALWKFATYTSNNIKKKIISTDGRHQLGYRRIVTCFGFRIYVPGKHKIFSSKNILLIFLRNVLPSYQQWHLCDLWWSLVLHWLVQEDTEVSSIHSIGSIYRLMVNTSLGSSVWCQELIENIWNNYFTHIKCDIISFQNVSNKNNRNLSLWLYGVWRFVTLQKKFITCLCELFMFSAKIAIFIPAWSHQERILLHQ